MFNDQRNNVLDLPDKAATLLSQPYAAPLQVLPSPLYKYISSTPPDMQKAFARHFTCRGYFVDSILQVVSSMTTLYVDIFSALKAKSISHIVLQLKVLKKRATHTLFGQK